MKIRGRIGWPVLLLGVLPLVAAGCGEHRVEDSSLPERTASYSGVRALEIEVDWGNVTVTGVVAGREVTVTRRVGANADAVATSKGGVLELVGRCRKAPASGSPSDASCTVSYDVRMPAGVPVRAQTRTGLIQVQHVERDLWLRGEVGGVVVNDCASSRVDVSTDFGDIDVRLRRADIVTLETDAGNIRASVRRPPREVRAETGTGDVTVDLPASAYRVDASSAGGPREVSNELGNDRTARRWVTARTSVSGAVRLRRLA